MRNAFWSILQQLIRQALVVVFMFVLARRVSPAEFGIIGIANIWNNLFYLFLELAFASVLVQRKEITCAHVSAAATLNLALGISITITSIILSGPTAALLKAPGAQPIIATISISFFLTAVASTKMALAQRDFRFKELALLDAMANSIAALVGIFLALLDFGAWAVVANSLVLNLLLVLFLARITPRRIFSLPTRPALFDVWTYGLRVFASSGLKHFLRSADSIVVGVLFGPERLGLYNFAQRITAAPTKSMQLGLASFLFPRASVSQDDTATLREIFLLSFKLLNYLILTFSALLVTVGAILIPLVFGEQWESANELIQVLLLIQLVAPAVIPLAELLKATNRVAWLFRWTLLQTILVIVSLALGRDHGFTATLIGVAGSYLLTIPVVAWMIWKVTDLSSLEFIRRVGVSYLLASGSALAVLLISQFNGKDVIMLAIGSGLVCTTQFLVAYRFDGDFQQPVKILLKVIQKRFT